MSVASQPMTTEEFLALPADGVHRELIRGELREKPMTTRGNPHGLTTINLAHRLREWLLSQPRPRGMLFAGEARVRLRSEPLTIVGIDLTYLSPEHAARTDPMAALVDGPPLISVEITSPSDTAEEIAEKVWEYLDSGVAMVWQVNPFFRTVSVHRAGLPVETFNESQELRAQPHLPGFRVLVSDIFAS
jgi:Uma2 family endonuclease